MFFLLLDEAGEQGRHAEAAHKRVTLLLPLLPSPVQSADAGHVPFVNLSFQACYDTNFLFSCFGRGWPFEIQPSCLGSKFSAFTN